MAERGQCINFKYSLFRSPTDKSSSGKKKSGVRPEPTPLESLKLSGRQLAPLNRWEDALWRLGGAGRHVFVMH